MKIRNYGMVASCAAITALVVTGCSGGDGELESAGGESSQPTASGTPQISGTLTGVFSSTFQDTYEQIAAAFEEEYPDVTTDFEYVGGDIGQVVMTQLQGSTAPDILTSFPGGDPNDNADSVAPLAANGLIVPLEVSWADQIPEDWKINFFHEGELYAYPGALQPLSAVYNQTKLDELGLEAPETLDEIFQLCQDALDNGVYAYGQGLGEAAVGPQMVPFGQAATLVDGPTFDAELAAGETTYPDSAWVDAFEIQQDMWDANCFGEGALGRSREQGGNAVAVGDALGLVDVGGVIPGLLAVAPDAEFTITGIPATNDASETKVAALPGYVNTINAQAANPDAAQAFLEFMGSPEASSIYATGFNSVPVLPNDDYVAPPMLAGFADLVASGNSVPLTTMQLEVQSTMNQQLQAMFLGDTTAVGVAESMQSVYKD